MKIILLVMVLVLVATSPVVIAASDLADSFVKEQKQKCVLATDQNAAKGVNTKVGRLCSPEIDLFSEAAMRKLCFAEEMKWVGKECIPWWEFIERGGAT
jgi:hypothetical protein